MATRITRDVLESHLRCSYKAYLKLAGEQGPKSDYEAMLGQAMQELRAKASPTVVDRCSDGGILRGLVLSHAVLARGAALILDSRIENDDVSLLFDGLRKDKGASHLGDFHYTPLLYYEGAKIRQRQKLLLALHSLILAGIQARQPESGVIVHGEECRLTKVLLTGGLVKRAQLSLEEIERARGSGMVPKLVLNEHCKVCEFRQRCQAQAEKDDDVSLLRWLSQKEINRYNRKGIFTLAQLSCTFRPRKRAKRAKKTNYARYAALQALAIREKRVYVYGTPSLPDKPVRVFLDVEGNPERSFVYLIGMIIREQAVERSYSFWIDNPDQEERVFRDFMGVLGQYEDFCVFHYGTYEKVFLRRVKAHAKQKRLAEKIIGNAVNVLSVVHAHIYFPTFSNGLKDVGSYLGCTWTEEQAAGIKALIWRKRWEETTEEAWKNKLLRYNLEDCAALKTVTECIYKIIEVDKQRDEKGASIQTEFPVGWAEDFHCLSTRRQWGKPSFELPDFEYINKCAYYDYQREKVLLRTNKMIRKACTLQHRRRVKKLRPHVQTKIRVRKCPHCRGTDIVRYSSQMHVKVAYDLQFSPGCIRRRVIHCVAALHHCRSCKKSFLPKKYKRRDKHFHGLKSWAIYQHVVHRISLQNLEVMFEECFGLRVGLTELHMMKSLMARRYRDTWRQILQRIVSGNVIHIDETLANLQKGKGYVWVLTNLEDVIYLYKPTREGDFLHGLLQGFAGVLVSDFFSAYDSLPCKQQKCLVHLIRDFNSDLQTSPYDVEFRSLASEFGRLLRCIIAGVDTHGLTRRHLHRYWADVECFYLALASRQYRSELAESCQKRLVKNKDRLFTFLDHDGVPWNNNSAEHAIKQFAYYRRLSDGQVSEKGLGDYLVLLSIYQTCRYKGVSFLKFLLSQEKDVNEFCQQGPKRYRPPFLEVYPKGFPRMYAKYASKEESNEDENLRRP